MQLIRIVLSVYQKLSIANFILSMEAIVNAVKNNPHFPSPQPTVLELEAQVTDLKTMAAAVKQGNLTVKPSRDLAKSTLYAMIQQLAAYCNYTAIQSSASKEEAVAKIRSANFFVAEPGANVGPLPAPGNVRGKSLSGACEIEFDSVHGAHMYLVLKTDGLPSETSVWTETLTTRVKHRFENLNAGQLISVRVYALGPVGKGAASDYCTVMAGM
ncbi:MAG: fibronectin type III domain-containing protein [Chitinophagales bacterium]|nr:fibronectin type III domain-containing protein [Chitinophagales bacterium]